MNRKIACTLFEAAKRDLERGFVAIKARWDIAFHLLPDKRVQSLAEIFNQIANTREVEHTETRVAEITPTEEGRVLFSLVREGGKEIINSAKNLGHFRNFREGRTYKIAHEFQISGKGEAESICVYEEFYRGPVMETMFLTYPTVELEISAHFPEGWEFDLISHASSPIECILRTKTSCHYRFQKALLSGTAVLYTLHPPSDTLNEDLRSGAVHSRNEEIAITE